jgi:hypothetical protein
MGEVRSARACRVFAAHSRLARRSATGRTRRAFAIHRHRFDSRSNDDAARTSRTLPSTVALACAILIACALLASGRAQAQAIRPWVPPSADSLVQWGSEAKVRFQRNTGDSIGGSNLRAYELVGLMGRRLLRSLGKGQLAQSPAIEPMLDSLGLDTEVEIDPEFPRFVLLMVRNPYRLTAEAVGFLYWYRGDDLRMQAAWFRGGMEPKMRVWWTGREEAPYAWGVVDRPRGIGRMRLTLLRLAADGGHWSMVQAREQGPDLGKSGGVSWVDINGDGHPELVAFVKGASDSLFEECSDCPQTITELVFNERPHGFEILDSRIVPSPYSTFELFVRLLIDNNRAAAARLLKSPTRLQAALAAGWGARRAPGTWKVESAEASQAWPRWMVTRFRGPQGVRRYRVDFEFERGRWVIRDWVERQIAPPGGTPPGSGGAAESR